MNKQAIAALALCAAAWAHAGEQEAYAGISADAASTAAALANGASEMNPLGWATVPIRLAIVEHAKTLPREEAQPLLDMTSAGGWGAAANNLLVLAGAGPAAPVAGVAIAYALWKNGEPQREFWRMCAVHKQFEPNLKCEFRAWKNEDVVAAAREVQPARETVIARAR